MGAIHHKTVPQMFEEELLESGIEERDLDQEEHLVQGCADPRVIEFPRDARARKQFRCAAAFSCVLWRFACFGDFGGKGLAGYSCELSCRHAHKR